MTVTIQAGNTDDKLSQTKWAEFVHALDFEIRTKSQKIHFFGGPSNFMPWQNVAWILEVLPENLLFLRESVILLRQKYSQDSVAWTEGTTAFV